MTRAFGCMLVGALAACGPARDTNRPLDDDHLAPLASCAEPPPAPALADVTETEPGYDDELAALDLVALPAQISTGALNPFTRDLVAYMLEVPPLALGVIDRDTVLSDDSHGADLKRAALAGFAFASANGAAGDADISFLRRGLFRSYACARLQHQELADALADVTLDDGEVIESVPKRGPRRVRTGTRDGTEDTVRVYVAETLVNDEGDVRETEVITHGARKDGALDFAAYDAHGDLVRSSTFAAGTDGTVVSSSPYTCMTCHRDRDTDTGFSVVVPALP